MAARAADVPLAEPDRETYIREQPITFSAAPIEFCKTLIAKNNVDFVERNKAIPDSYGELAALWGTANLRGLGSQKVGQNLARFTLRNQIPSQYRAQRDFIPWEKQGMDGNAGYFWNITFYPVIGKHSMAGVFVVPMACIYASHEKIIHLVCQQLQGNVQSPQTYVPQFSDKYQFFVEEGMAEGYRRVNRQLHIDPRVFRDVHARLSFAAACAVAGPSNDAYFTTCPFYTPASYQSIISRLTQLYGSQWWSIGGASAGLAIASCFAGGPPVAYTGQFASLQPDTAAWKNNNAQWTLADTARSYNFVHTVSDLPYKAAWALKNTFPTVFPFKTQFGTPIPKWFEKTLSTNPTAFNPKLNLYDLQLGRNFYSMAQANVGIGLYLRQTPLYLAPTLDDAVILGMYATMNFFLPAEEFAGNTMTNLQLIAGYNPVTGMAHFTDVPIVTQQERDQQAEIAARKEWQAYRVKKQKQEQRQLARRGLTKKQKYTLSVQELEARQKERAAAMQKKQSVILERRRAATPKVLAAKRAQELETYEGRKLPTKRLALERQARGLTLDEAYVRSVPKERRGLESEIALRESRRQHGRFTKASRHDWIPPNVRPEYIARENAARAADYVSRVSEEAREMQEEREQAERAAQAASTDTAVRAPPPASATRGAPPAMATTDRAASPDSAPRPSQFPPTQPAATEDTIPPQDRRRSREEDTLAASGRSYALVRHAAAPSKADIAHVKRIIKGASSEQEALHRLQRQGFNAGAASSLLKIAMFGPLGIFG